MTQTPEIPDYLRRVYTWAYLDPDHVRWLDRQVVVQAILWGNANRLAGRVVEHITPGSKVLQIAAVYGNFSPRLARAVGPSGALEVIDIAPLQVNLTRNKLAGLSQASVRVADAREPQGKDLDAVVCFFLLHEVPESLKAQIVPALLESVRPGGKVIFVDYHRPAWWHPLRGLMWLVFRTLEPFALALWSKELRAYAGEPGARFRWTKDTFFGGLYQRVVAVRPEQEAPR